MLVVVRGPDEGKTFELPPMGVTLGRNAQCGIHLDHAAVSRQHARIFQEEDSYFIEDLGSRNGLSVNGRRGTRIRLQNCDQIKMCGYVFRFEEFASSETAKTELVEETSV